MGHVGVARDLRVALITAEDRLSADNPSGTFPTNATNPITLRWKIMAVPPTTAPTSLT